MSKVLEFKYAVLRFKPGFEFSRGRSEDMLVLVRCEDVNTAIEVVNNLFELETMYCPAVIRSIDLYTEETFYKIFRSPVREIMPDSECGGIVISIWNL